MLSRQLKFTEKGFKKKQKGNTMPNLKFWWKEGYTVVSFLKRERIVHFHVHNYKETC